jgi:hypothetical protein
VIATGRRPRSNFWGLGLLGDKNHASIEIACIGLDLPTRISVEGFALVSERGLKSHRMPSRFQTDFNALSGCLYHLGNPKLRDPTQGGAFFAYELLSEASRDASPPSFLEIAPEHVGEVRVVLANILAASPLGRALFTSDWQFGPEWPHRFGPVGLDDFWQLHASRNLQLNSSYALVG